MLDHDQVEDFIVVGAQFRDVTFFVKIPHLMELIANQDCQPAILDAMSHTAFAIERKIKAAGAQPVEVNVRAYIAGPAPACAACYEVSAQQFENWINIGDELDARLHRLGIDIWSRIGG